MKSGNFYKHPNCTDTCIEIMTCYTIPENGMTKVKARWWRVRFGKITYCMNIIENFKKPTEYWKQWKRIGV